MNLEIINKLYLELSHVATAITERELELQRNAISGEKLSVLKAIMFDQEKGWAKISTGLTQDFQSGINSFDIEFTDGTRFKVSFSVSEI